MPIEPTNVSAQPVREVDSASKSNLWSPAQGNSARGKDRPFSSVWESTVNGAQESAKSETAESVDSSKRRDEDDARNQKEAVTDFVFVSRSAPSSGNAFSSIRLSRPPQEGAGEARSKEDSVAALKERSAPRETDSNADRDPIETLEEDDELKAKAKTKGPPPLLDFARRAPEAGYAAGSAQAAGPETSATAATPAQTVAPVADTSRSPQAPATVARSTASVATPVSPPAASKTPVTPAEPSKPAPTASPLASGVAATQPSVPQATPPVQAGTEKLDTANVGQTAKPATPVIATAQPPQNAGGSVASAPSALAPQATESAAQAQLIPQQPATSEGELAFDANKAKAALAEALRPATEAKTPIQPTANQPATNQPAASGAAKRDLPAASGAPAPAESVKPSSETLDLDSARPIVAESKSPVGKAPATVAASSTEAGKVPVSSSNPGHASTQAAVESAITKAQASGASDEASAAAKAAEQPQIPARAVPAPVVAAPLGNTNLNTPANSLGMAGGLAAASGAATGGAAGGQTAGENSPEGGAKQSATAMSAVTSSKSVGTEKAGPDNAQAFEAKVATAEASQKHQAVAKAQTTSYVSKTAEQVKEVYAALNKSVESLVSNKPGDMNMRIDFREGGSISLKVTMEGGQINTRMQTDLPGLEGLIKSHWSEIAADWGAKGIKLAAPQFQPGAAPTSEQPSSDSYLSFDSREDRSGQSQAGFDSGRSGGRGLAGQMRGSRAAAPGGSATAGPDAGSQPANVVTDRELKAYA